LQLDPSAFIADQELIQALQTYAMKVSCGGDCILFRQGDAPAGLYIINKGEVILTMSSLAGESVLSIQVPPGSVLGLPGLIGNEPYTMTAIANCGAEISFVPRNDVLARCKPTQFCLSSYCRCLRQRCAQRVRQCLSLEDISRPLRRIRAAAALTHSPVPCDTLAHVLSRKS
jgi:CRP-like cAMP-binding protein